MSGSIIEPWKWSAEALRIGKLLMASKRGENGELIDPVHYVFTITESMDKEYLDWLQENYDIQIIN